MKRLRWVVYLLTAACAITSDAQDATKVTDPDKLYEQREYLQNALEAASIWESRLKLNRKDFESAWKLARACYWLGGHVEEDERGAQYKRGIKAATAATELRPTSPEGHFWLAANMGGRAESGGKILGLYYKDQIKEKLEEVLTLDSSFQHGSADRALGRWYCQVPEKWGGNKNTSIAHLKRSLTHDPNSIASHYFLAETYEAMGMINAARMEAENVIELPANLAWRQEDGEFKIKAERLLHKLNSSQGGS